MSTGADSRSVREDGIGGDSLVTAVDIESGKWGLVSLHVAFACNNVGSHLGCVLKGLLNLASGNM